MSPGPNPGPVTHHHQPIEQPPTARGRRTPGGQRAASEAAGGPTHSQPLTAAPTANSQSQDDALKAYGELLELQAVRYPSDPARASCARADTFKLIGNVYVAMRMFNRCVRALRFMLLPPVVRASLLFAAAGPAVQHRSFDSAPCICVAGWGGPRVHCLRGMGSGAGVWG